MRELRKARNITQVQLAKTLGVKQEQVSRLKSGQTFIFRPSDALSRRWGGELILSAKFPDGAPVRLTGFSELGR